MKNHQAYWYLLLCTALHLIFNSNISGATYYLSASGNDSYTAEQARNKNTPWKSISRLNAYMSSLQAGDSILFERGSIFYGGIVLTTGGSGSQPIVFAAYGVGDKPVVSGL